jgi:hypothetical protein
MSRQIVDLPARDLTYFPVTFGGKTVMGFWDPTATLTPELETVKPGQRVRFLDGTTGVIVSEFYVDALGQLKTKMPLFGSWVEVKRGGWLSAWFPWAFKSYLTPTRQLRNLVGPTREVIS